VSGGAWHAEGEPAFLSIEEAGRMLRRREISPAELAEAALARIERLNPEINAFLTVVAERARRQARLAEREFGRARGGSAAAGRIASPLFGIPIALKDNYWTRGIRTTAGSRILADFIPDKDSDVAEKLAQAGAILVGKTNMHEFAYGITNENPHYGAVHNPWALERTSGGSSGGSGAAVAAGMCFAATGTDTGGSIRIPASLCGIVGLKPTYGLVSVAGVIPLAESMDHAGPLARSVSDVCAMFQAMAGKYPEGARAPDFRRLRKDRPRRMRLGWPREYFFERVDAEVLQAIQAAAKLYESLGARIEEVRLPHVTESADPSTNIALAEAARYHESQGFFPARAADYGKDVSSRLEMGAQVRAVDYLGGLEMKRKVEQDFDDVFERVDAILAPATPITAPRIGEHEVKIGGEKETVRSALVRMNRPANLTGHPALSIPCGYTREKLPVGLQLIGPRYGEARLLAIALAYEDATEWLKRHPAL
jgi:aspartyl-tRNA(Asn)/glutamyl-tRNA(Gln) amidotransferase subunit A